MRTIDQRHFDVQILGGIAMHHRSIAEMQTGEGKTLTATLAAVSRRAHRARRASGHGQRLSGPARRRMDGADLSNARHDRRRRAHADEHGPAPQGLCLRHHLRHGQGIRLRLSPRSAAVAAHVEGQSDLLAHMLGHQSDASGRQARAAAAAFRAGRRGRQHADRRGPHAADHQRPADGGRKGRSRAVSLDARRRSRNSSRRSTTPTTTRRRRSS